MIVQLWVAETFKVLIGTFSYFLAPAGTSRYLQLVFGNIRYCSVPSFTIWYPQVLLGTLRYY